MNRESHTLPSCTRCLSLLASFAVAVAGFSADVRVDPTVGQRPISPLIYGKNNSLSDRSDAPLTTAEWQRLKDAGVRFFRESGGNNSTKYNWERKLSSHPDWYNAVFDHDWDYAAQSLERNIPRAYGMWAVPALGWVATTDAFNFDCWAYDRCVGGNAGENWTGGGDHTLYLEEWPPEKAVGILPHWFEPEGLGLEFERFKYWNIDNEPEIWNGTHDDVVKEPMPFEVYFQKFAETAKRMRLLYPDIRIVGPVFANEWQWYNWNNDAVAAPNGDRYNATEYFFKRLGEEEAATGLRLLDVFDLHWYPGESSPADVLQLHRALFDTTYNYPGANGVRRVNGGWDDSQTKEYIFKRARDWSARYLGRVVGLGMSEYGNGNANKSVSAVSYASILGTFANEGVELFTPWSWESSYMEVLHLFSVYTGRISVSAISDNEELLSAYASLRGDGRTLFVVIVNRRLSGTESVSLGVLNAAVAASPITVRQLSGFGTVDTFVSATQNALQTSSISSSANGAALTVPALSITALEIPLAEPVAVDFGRLELASVARRPDGAYDVFFEGEPGVEYDLVVSADLESWQVLKTFSASVTYRFEPSSIGIEGRFFCRARVAR